jgi:hypothetical protein
MLHVFTLLNLVNNVRLLNSFPPETCFGFLSTLICTTAGAAFGAAFSKSTAGSAVATPLYEAKFAFVILAVLSVVSGNWCSWYLP